MVQIIVALLIICSATFWYFVAFSMAVTFWPITLFLLFLFREPIVKSWNGFWKEQKDWQAAHPNQVWKYDLYKGRWGYYNKVTKKWRYSNKPPVYGEKKVDSLEEKAEEVRKQRRKDQQAYSEICKHRRKEQYASNL